MAFAYAALLRWLTPIPGLTSQDEGVYKGWLDGYIATEVGKSIGDNADNTGADGVVEYADGLHHCVQQGWFEYKCSLTVKDSGNGDDMPLPTLLESCIGRRPNKCVVAVRAYLFASAGGDLDRATIGSHPDFENLVHAIASFYSRMVAIKFQEGSKILLDILKELESNTVGGLIGFDTPCSAMMDYYLNLSGI